MLRPYDYGGNAMLTSWDEFLCHQLPTTMDHVYTSDPAWTERIYISLYDVANKDTILGCGIGQYPNKNVQDGFATIWHQGKQYNRSEEHTSELQSQSNLVCRLLLEK